jgi:hypothetical protein
MLPGSSTSLHPCRCGDPSQYDKPVYREHPTKRVKTIEFSFNYDIFRKCCLKIKKFKGAGLIPDLGGLFQDG